MKTALVAGATGQVGTHLLELLSSQNQYSKVIVLSRQALELPNKFEIILCDSDSIHLHKNELVADDVFCCLGTTIRKAKTKEAFRKVDFDYPLLLAKITLEKGAKHFLLVSALGANANSSIFYNKVKGEIEDAIRMLGFSSFSILRPSLLLGNRSERRSGEEAAKIFYKAFGFLIPKKFKGIEAKQVAKAMLTLANMNKNGVHVYESNVLQDL